MENQKIVKISSGSLDFEYEIIRTNAPEWMIKESIIHHLINSTSATGFYYEYLMETGYEYEVLGSHEDDAESIYEVDYIIDIDDLIKKHCVEVMENGRIMYKRKCGTMGNI